MSGALSPTEVDAWQGLLRTHAALVRALDSELRAAHELPLSSYIVLREVAAAPEGRVRLNALAERTMLSRAGLSGLLDRLEAARLLERQPCEGDARGTYAVVTGAGLRKLDHASRTHHDSVRRRYTGRLTHSQIEELGHVWRRLLAG